MELITWLLGAGIYFGAGVPILSMAARYAVKANDSMEDIRRGGALIWLLWPAVVAFMVGYGYYHTAGTIAVASAKKEVKDERKERAAAARRVEAEKELRELEAKNKINQPRDPDLIVDPETSIYRYDRKGYRY